MNEEKLLKACLKGDRRAQKELYERFARKMFGVCLMYASEKNMAEDFLQEGFIRVFMKLDSFKAIGSLEGWIRRIIINTSLELLRKKDILRHALEIDDFNDYDSTKPDSFYSYLVDENFNDDNDGIFNQISSEILNSTIQEMPVGFRTVFNLYVMEEYSHREIGQMLDISEGTSKSQYARARVWLQKRLNERKVMGA